MVIYDESGNPQDIREDMNAFKEKVHQEALQKQQAEAAQQSKQQAPQTSKQAVLMSKLKELFSMPAPKIRQPQRQIRQPRRKKKSSYSKSYQTAQGLANFIAPYAGIKQQYSKEEMRQIKAELAFLRLQKMKMKMQRQLARQQGQRQPRQMPYRRIRNYRNMPPQLRDYYIAQEQGQSSSPTLSRMRGNAPQPYSQRQEVSLLNHNVIVQKGQRSQNRMIARLPTETWAAYRAPIRKGKIGVDSDNNSGW